MAPADPHKKVVKKAVKMKDPVDGLQCLPTVCERKTLDGETLTFDTAWATHLSAEIEEWVFDLFARNMREMYSQSQWGWDPEGKKHELQATTARYLIVRNSRGERIAYTHYRFDVDFGVPVVYCYEIQVEPSYQKKGVGSILLNTLETLAKKTNMEKVMATVFAYNDKSLGFFHKNGYTTDPSCPEPEQGLDYLILQKPVSEMGSTSQ